MPSTELDGAPNLGALYLKAAGTMPMRRTDPTKATLPDTEYVRRDVTIDQAHLAEYDRVCGFGMRDALPVTYPHILSFPMSVRLMTDQDFPFPLVGLVHVANRITQHEPLTVTDALTLRVRLSDPRPHPKGTQFDVITEAGVGERTVWTESSTYLRRGKRDESAEKAEAVTELDSGSPTATWSLPGDLGRRYGSVSGDRNPIHMHPWTAKAFGFPRAIAHGMWSKARCLAAFEGRLPEAYTVMVEFAKPVLLPSEVDFTEADRAEGKGKLFALHSKSGKTHLRGEWC